MSSFEVWMAKNEGEERRNCRKINGINDVRQREHVNSVPVGE